MQDVGSKSSRADARVSARERSQAEAPRPRFISGWRVGVLLVFLAGLGLALIKPSLSEVHWDAPIMLYASKRVLDTDFHANFARNAAEVARQVTQADWDRSVSYFPEPFWVFTKLGHLSLLAGFVALGETPEEGLRIAHLGFGALLAASVAMALLLARNLALLRGWSGDPRSLAAGLMVAGLSCVLSGVFSYMSGNLVSEVPALFFVCAALLALSAAMRGGSLALAALSGLLLFAAYGCRPDFAWVAICFALALVGAARPPLRCAGICVPILVGAGVAVLGLAVHAWIYRPLADPRLYLAFADLLRSYAPNPPGHFLRLVVIAGGLSWVGVLLALFQRPWARGVGFGLVWLGLTGLPWLFQAVLGSAAQSRMFVMAWPPLLLLASLGWAATFERARRLRRVRGMIGPIAVAGLCALVSVPASYAGLRQLPGAWRLQYLRAWLVPDPVERRSYPLQTLASMRDAIHTAAVPALVIVDPRWQRRGNLDILRFLGPEHGPRGVDLTFVPWPHARWADPRSPTRAGEPVVYRSSMTAAERQAWASGRLRVLLLSEDEDPGWASSILGEALAGRVVRGDGLVLAERTPLPRP